MSKARRILILLIAIGSAVLAAVLAQSFMGQQPTAPPVVEAPRLSTIPVLIAAKDLAIGERLNSLSVEWREWPRENVAAFMITRDARPNAIAEIDGSRARAPMLLGEPISDRKILAVKDGNLMSSLVREGLRGVAIRISSRTAGSGFILPNDRVDIIATLKVKIDNRVDDLDREMVFSRTIVTNVRVLAVNQSIAPDTASLSDLQTALLELNPLQAEIVARAEAQGELSLALRSFGEISNGDTADDMPALANLTEIPNSVEIFKGGVRFIYSCEPRCESALQLVNSPFPLIVRDVGIDPSATKR
jgi:pilus assembly protein CpaB